MFADGNLQLEPRSSVHKVAIVTPSNGGDAPVVVARNLIDGFVREGFSAGLFYLTEKGGSGNRSERLLTWRHFIELFRTHDIVHTHGLRPDLLAAAVVFVLQHRRRARWISTLHCDMERDLRDLHGRAIAIPTVLVWKTALLSADAQIFLSDAIAAHYAHGVRYAVIRNGIPIECTSSAMPDVDVVRQLEYLSRTHTLMGTLANTRPLKRIDAIIRALARHPMLAFAHFGDGPERGGLMDLANQLGVAERCVFFGFRPDAVNYLPLLDVYVNHSTVEASPLSILEAFRAGVPVVAPRISPFIEMFTCDCDQLFDPNEPDTFGRAVLKVARRRAEIAEYQRHLQKERFSLEAMISDHLTLYRQSFGAAVIDRFELHT